MKALPSAYYVATHEAVRDDGDVIIRPIGEERARQVGFMVLHDARI